MEAGSVAENFHSRNLFFGGGLQALQVFARNQVPAAITQLKNEQVQAWSKPIFDFGHARLVLQRPGTLDGTINLGVGSNDLMSDGLMLLGLLSDEFKACHVFPPT